MIKKVLLIITLALLPVVLTNRPAKAQGGDQSFRVKLESILFNASNYRYSTISVWQLKDVKDIRKLIKERDTEALLGELGTEANEDCVEREDPSITSSIETQVNQGIAKSQIQRQVMLTYGRLPDEFECIYNYYQSQIVGTSDVVKAAYIVTTRKATIDQLVPNTIIAMIITYNDEGTVIKNVDGASPSNIFTYPELKQFDLDPAEYRAENMYALLENAFLQGMVEDKTLDAQGIGGMAGWMPQKYGTSRSLLSNEADINPRDIQLFKRISGGEALDMFDKHYELLVSPDQIKLTKYDYPQIVYSDGFRDTLSNITNRALPDWGFELKYGIDEINYPSFFSERMTANFLWERAKFGLILPTNGWASISEDAFDMTRKLTHGGAGIAAEFDLPFLVIPKSGVWNINAAYVFGDAEMGPNNPDDIDPQTIVLPQVVTDNNLDHMIRFNAGLHYTFGISIDKDYLLRFGIGGTVYTVESWYQKVEEDALRERTVSFSKHEEETIGGLSGKISFMAKNLQTPFGLSVQYFDEALYTHIWLQVPIVENTFALQIDAKGYFKAFTDEPRLWENESVFIPMARALFFF